MDLKEDAHLLEFARQTAADEGGSESVRGQALLLTAKLGGRMTSDGLFACLENPSRSPSGLCHARDCRAGVQAVSRCHQAVIGVSLSAATERTLPVDGAGR